MDLAPMFAVARKRLVRLRPAQVQGIERIVMACMARWTDHRWTAYALATVEHETARTFQPIVERGARSYFAQYDAGTSKGARLGNVTPGDGWRYRGRGYVQLTGLVNYRRMSDVCGVDLVTNPGDALTHDVAMRILLVGMEGGLFTGKALPDYLNETKTDWAGARRVINGSDCAQAIAALAQSWHAALLAGLAPAKVTP